MKKIILLLFGVLIFVSCGTTKKLPEEKLEVLQAFSIYTTANKLTIYYKSINETSDFVNDWGKIIKNMNVMVSHYNRKIRKHENKIIDSISSMTKYGQKKKDSLIQAYLKKSQIKPWELFSLEDRTYMAQQVKRYKTIKWPSMLPYYDLTRSKEVRQFSIPILSKSGKYAVIFVLQPGYRGLEVFRKVNGQWVYYFSSTLMIV